MVFFPSGPAAARLVRNASESVARVAMFSLMSAAGAVVYPDHDMIWMWTADGAVDIVVERSSAVDEAAPWSTGQAKTRSLRLRQRSGVTPDGSGRARMRRAAPGALPSPPVAEGVVIRPRARRGPCRDRSGGPCGIRWTPRRGGVVRRAHSGVGRVHSGAGIGSPRTPPM
jgi:hypothetical protein